VKDDDDEFALELHQHKHIPLVVVVVFELPLFDVLVRVQHNKHHHLLLLLDMVLHVELVQLFAVLFFQLDYPI
jgi:hypothetical protein